MADYVYHDSARRFNCLLWDVETVALAFATLVGVWDIVNLIIFNLRWISILTAVDLLAWIGIVLASVKQVPKFYLPALVINMVYTVLHGVVCILLLAVLFLGINNQADVCNLLVVYTGFDLSPFVANSDTPVWTLVWFFCFLLTGLFLSSVEVIVYRAYVKMKEENRRHNIPIAELHSGSKKPLISLNSTAPQVTGTTIYC